MPRENSKNAKAKKITIIRSKRKLLQLKRKEELSHNIHYISKVPVRVVMDRDFLILSLMIRSKNSFRISTMRRLLPSWSIRTEGYSVL